MESNPKKEEGRKMKRIPTVVLTGLVIGALLLAGCGVPKEQFEAVKDDLANCQTNLTNCQTNLADCQQVKEKAEADNVELLKEKNALVEQLADLRAKLQEETKSAVVRLPAEVKLDVPFEPNLGNTCFSSSFAMVIRYWGKDVTVQDVLRIVGYPPFQGYEHPELVDWMGKNYGLELKYLPYSKLEDIKTFLSKGWPVVVHQTFSLTENTGHNRVVVGYNDSIGVFIVNDPSNLGSNYSISYETFETLWKNITLYERGPENKAYLVIPLE